MKFNELQIGVQYAVIPAWDYSSKDKKDPSYVRRRDVAKAELVSIDKYDYKVFRNDSPISEHFAPAPKGSRVVGYMVKSSELNNNGTDTYWLARPQDIVAPYEQLEQRWTREEQEQIEHERKMREERERQERIQREQREKAERSVNALKESLTLIIGAERTAKVRFDINNRRDDKGDYLPHAEMTLDSRIAQLLIEKVLEAKDMVG